MEMNGTQETDRLQGDLREQNALAWEGDTGKDNPRTICGVGDTKILT